MKFRTFIKVLISNLIILTKGFMLIILSADYYTKEGNLIHGITIDCGKGKWSSHVTNQDNEIENWLTGDLAEPCVDGKEFDIWLKIHQAKMMSWIFNAQALQYKTRITKFRRGQEAIVYRNRTLEVPTKYGSDQGDYLKAKVTGSAVITRVTWGQCISWPLSLQSNCQVARLWVMARSKMPPKADPGGLGYFGSDWQTFAPQCFLESKYYDWLQSLVHPDRTARHGFPFCCCVDMVTGLTVDMPNPCDEGTQIGQCDRSCMQWANIDLIREVMIEQDKQAELEELEEHLARLV